MSEGVARGEGTGSARGALFTPLLLSWTTGIAMLVALVYFGGVWNILANTRLLDPLIRGGIIALTDADAGFIYGVPDQQHYLAAQDAIDWELVVFSAGMFMLLWFIKAYQFHAVARMSGIAGSFGHHARAHLYGRGVGRLVPFGAGTAATASALESHGVPPKETARVNFVAEIFVAFEIVVFALVGLYLSGVTTWIGELFWPLVILAIAWFLVRPAKGEPGGLRDTRGAVRQAIRALAHEPRMLVWLCFLSIVAFLLADEGAYLIAQAFSSQNVILNIEGGVILMAVVGAQLARLVRFTPGGIGQYEWGFASVLYVGGVGFPEAATVALLVGALRYLTGGIVFLVLMLTRGVDTNLRTVIDGFTGRAREEAA